MDDRGEEGLRGEVCECVWGGNDSASLGEVSAKVGLQRRAVSILRSDGGVT